ncbi:MAG: TolC family protein [Planctomycetota bacterium]|jgi:outer membrane protein TolC
MTGCADRNYKREADEQAYGIIDQKWNEDFGTKANYKVSDVAPSPNDIQIDKDIAVPDVLTLPQAVALATAHNREYQTQREELFIRALDLRLTRHEFETQFFGGFSGGYNADRNDEAAGTEVNIGFRRLLAGGTRISTEIAGAWVPLLRGSERKIVVENLTQAERDTLYEVRSFNRFRKTFVVSVIAQYYKVLQQREEAKNARTNYITLAWVAERVEKLANAGWVPLLELDEARQKKLQASNIYSQAQKEYQQAIDEFKITLSLSTAKELKLDEKEFDALRTAGMSEPDFSQEQVTEAALVTRLDLANGADAVIDARRKVYVTEDSLRADASLIGAVGAISARRGNRQTLGWFREEYGVGLELDLPLDRVPEQNVYRKALIKLNQRQREYEQASDVVTLEVRQAHRDLSEAAERYKVLSEALELAQQRFNRTFLLLQYGKASSRRVLQAQGDLFDAQNDAAQALVDYTLATLNFYRDTGVLHVRPDGMWEL